MKIALLSFLFVVGGTNMVGYSLLYLDIMDGISQHLISSPRFAASVGKATLALSLFSVITSVVLMTGSTWLINSYYKKNKTLTNY